jgi:hypothetical protein
VAQGPFVPSGFVVPLALATEHFRLEPLGPQHNDSDYEAWSSSMEHIHRTPGWERSSWPDDRSLVDNLRDLQRHADDFENRAGFTYTVLDPVTDDVIGCVYIYPDDSEQQDARVLSWVRESRPELDVKLWRAVTAWLADDWPFACVAYAERDSSAPKLRLPDHANRGNRAQVLDQHLAHGELGQPEPFAQSVRQVASSAGLRVASVPEEIDRTIGGELPPDDP